MKLTCYIRLPPTYNKITVLQYNSNIPSVVPQNVARKSGVQTLPLSQILTVSDSSPDQDKNSLEKVQQHTLYYFHKWGLRRVSVHRPHHYLRMK